MNNNTSLITILSSEHGRLRREQRDIQKRDLQKALRHGKREKAWGDRWKVEYDGIVFITNKSLNREITSFPSPLSNAPVDDDTYNEHVKAMEIISRKADMCTSHTILVVDNSGSMRTHDIPLHRDRQVAAFSTMALEYVAEQLFNGNANNRDVVSLVEFSKTATIIFRKEPISWVLYNKLLNRRDRSGYLTRTLGKTTDTIWCESNYLPALIAAEELLAFENHEDCALSMFFLSDGEPTDAAHNSLLPSAALRLMKERIATIARRFDYQLNMSFVGFGGSTKDFECLKSMTEAANESAGMPLARFVYCDKLANSIGAAVTSLAQSTTLTRTALMSGERRTKENTRTDIKPEESSSSLSSSSFSNVGWDSYKIVYHSIFNPRTNDWEPYSGFPVGALREENLEEARMLLSLNRLPPCLKMNKGYLGTGVERVAYRCHLAEENGAPKLGAMIAKETLRADRIDEHIAFHKSFCVTQSLAAHLATEFNTRLQGLPNYSKIATPNVCFLKCSVLGLKDPQWPQGERGVLVEKQLDTERFEWRKWNNNAGAVDGKISHRPMDVEYELAKLNRMTLRNVRLDEVIIEEGFSRTGRSSSVTCKVFTTPIYHLRLLS